MRSGFVLVVGLLAVAGVLLATGVVDVGIFRSAGRGEGPPIAPPEQASADPRESAGLAGKPGGRGAKRGAEVPGIDPADLVPSEVAGTSPSGAVIKGRVVDGEPKVAVEGATVRLTRPDSLFHYLRAKREGRYDDLTARTDAQGRYVFRDVVPAGGYALVAKRKGGAAATQTGLRVAARQILQAPDLVLGASGGLGGRVVDGAGQPVPDVRIAIAWEVSNEFRLVLADPDTLPWTEAETKSGADGRWSVKALEPGDKTIVYAGPSGAAYVRTPVTVTAGEQRDDVDLVLAGSLSLSGKVVWADGSPIAGARVLAGMLGNPSGHTADAGADGTFAIGGLAPGSYTMGALVPGLPPRYDLDVKHEAGEKGITFTFEAAGSLSGRVVVKETGKAVESFRVATTLDDPSHPSFEARLMRRVAEILGPTAFESRDGSFRFERLAAGTYTLSVDAEGHPPTSVPGVRVLAGQGTADVTVELADGRRVAGSVVDERGAPVASAEIRVVEGDPETSDEELADDVSSLRSAAESDGAGAFETVPLSPAVYAVVVTAEGCFPRVLRKLDLRPSSRLGVDVRLARGGQIRVRVVDPQDRPAPYMDLVAFRATGESASGWTDGDGTWSSSALVPGRWVVAWSSARLTRVLSGAPPPGAPPATEAREPSPEERYDAARKADGVEVDLAVGETADATVRLPRLVKVTGTLRVRREKPVGRHFSLVSATAWVFERVALDAEGRYAVERVEPGEYEIAYDDRSTSPPTPFHRAVAIPDIAEFTLDVDFP